MKWYLQVLKNYANFNGRARRKEYWMFALFNIIFLVLAMIVDNVAGTTIKGLPYGLFYFLYAISIMIPGISVSVRRLHDIGKSGWYYFIALIPIVGPIWLLVLMCSDSIPGENQYGQNPKENNIAQTIDTQQISSTNESSTGDTLIIIAVIWLFVTRLIWAVLPKIIDNAFSTEWFKVLNGLMGLIWAFVPLCLAFAIKNKSKQILLFIISSLYLLYGIYQVVFQYNKII